MGAVYAGCFYVLMDTKQPASRLQQILGILDSDVIVTSEKYLKDLEKLEFKGKVLMAPDLAAEQENEAVLNENRHWMWTRCMEFLLPGQQAFPRE